MHYRHIITWYDFSIVFEVDDEKMNNAQLNEINNFWSDADYRLENENGNLLHAVLKLYAAQAFHYSLGCLSMANAFAEGEGFAPINGDYGIKILSYDCITFDASDMFIRSHPASSEQVAIDISI